jgi:DNA-binding transcriptional ArsR family regulator
MEWLSDALTDSVRFECVYGGVEHLTSVFPEMDGGEVRTELERVSRRRRTRSIKRGVVDDPGIDILGELASEILLRLYDRAEYETGFLKKLYIKEILDISRVTGQTQSRVSAALDMLIDAAMIHPETQFEPSNGAILARRVFGADGEVVKRQVIRHALAVGKGMELVA